MLESVGDLVKPKDSSPQPFRVLTVFDCDRTGELSAEKGADCPLAWEPFEGFLEKVVSLSAVEACGSWGGT